ncbi:FAD:protein FMN transferase [Panacibacter ginsenosidivorans]|uniref:FAD:protein FMN transferase n=1 Tax=Panacibacter ginsenosidivorans TaxID=1813871 RepID=A0A5B8V939_9BACT|nr:FAD:protein FMN transferase [Panacibacter ginsenosidivorans]QEC67361.1 FAD:protein FMN transferase [Panacibacter ginsenosidivorans]
MRLVFAFIILSAFLFFKPIDEKPVKEIIINGLAQGTTYHIIYFAADSIIRKAQIDSVLDKIDSSLSIYKPYSLISRFNQSNEGITVDQHFINVINSSLTTYKATGGLFDITVEPLVEAWGFATKHITEIPTATKIDSLLKCIGSNNLSLKKNFLHKSKPCIKIDVNGIAQGYTVDVLANFFELQGIHNYLVELGGEIRLKGKKIPGNEKMKVGIESPPDDDMDDEIMQQVLKLDSGAITTSGNYRKYYESNGKKISHLIDPRTGYSIQNEMISATVYAKDATTADAFDNALMVMGLDSAMHFVEKRKDLAAYFIYKRKDGTVADTATTKFYRLMHP